MIKSLRTKLSLAVTGFIVAMAVGEIVLRIAGFHAVNYYVYQDSFRLGVPYAEFTHKKENDNRVYLNNLGYHDYDRGKESSDYRIALVGDSFVEALQVPIDSLLTSLVERTFRANYYPVEVLNAGMSGMGTAIQYAMWKAYLSKNSRIDHLVLCLYIGNDLHDNSEVLAVIRGRNTYGPFVNAQGEVYINPFPPRKRVLDALSERSVLVGVVRQRLHLLLKEQSARPNVENQLQLEGRATHSEILDATVDSHEEVWIDVLNGTLSLIRRWNRELRGAGIHMSILLLPTSRKDDVNKHERALINKLVDLANEDQIPLHTIDFEGNNPYAYYSFDGKTLGHFNFRGHRIAAEQVFEWLIEHDAIKRLKTRKGG